MQNNMGNMKYKVGDKVQIKSLDWYNENKNANGCVELRETTDSGYNFNEAKSCFCGDVVTINKVHYNFYTIEEDEQVWYWTDEMIEGLVEEKVSLKLTGKAIKNNEMCVSVSEYILPEGYKFVDENGNVINTMKIVLEKKKPKYPATYEECCKVLGYSGNYNIILTTDVDNKLFNALYKLKVCRDAYWKIAGDEMGLDKPWEPDWDNLSTNHEFIKINKGCFTYSSRVLVFPTEEMRDAFKENFDPDIEICKEFL